MKYVVETSSGATIYIPRFINIGSANQKRIRAIDTQSAWRSYKMMFRNASEF
jgi:hypothetical protein